MAYTSDNNNIGLLAGPWFEGRMTGCLVNILGGKSTFTDMLILVLCYVIAIAVVQISRYIKRFYVRRFANNVNKNMKEVLYNSLVHKSRPQLQEETWTYMYDIPAYILYHCREDEGCCTKDRCRIQGTVRKT